MRISFDIDDTLILHGKRMAREKSWAPDWLTDRFSEPLRAGARNLFAALKQNGHEVWIYTTSLRSPRYIHFWLWLHSVKVDGIVNEDIHFAKLKEINSASSPSKYPPAFGIDLHIDDSPGVAMEGEQHGFNVIVIKPDDEQWAEDVLSHVRCLGTK